MTAFGNNIVQTTYYKGAQNATRNRTYLINPLCPLFQKKEIMIVVLIFFLSLPPPLFKHARSHFGWQSSLLPLAELLYEGLFDGHKGNLEAYSTADLNRLLKMADLRGLLLSSQTALFSSADIIVTEPLFIPEPTELARADMTALLIEFSNLAATTLEIEVGPVPGINVSRMVSKPPLARIASLRVSSSSWDWYLFCSTLVHDLCNQLQFCHYNWWLLSSSPADPC